MPIYIPTYPATTTASTLATLENYPTFTQLTQRLAPFVNQQQTNTSAITAEITRATAIDTTLTNNLASQVIKQIFDTTNLQANINDEVIRAKALETTLATKITSNTASLTGMLNFTKTNAIESTGNTLTLGGSTTTEVINLGTSNATQVINIGTGSTAKTINLGSSADTVVIAGSTVSTSTTNLAIADNQIILNKGGLAGSGSNAGIQIEEAGIITGFIQQNANRNGYNLKPSNSTTIGLNQSLLTTDTPSFSALNVAGSITATNFIGNSSGFSNQLAGDVTGGNNNNPTTVVTVAGTQAGAIAEATAIVFNAAKFNKGDAIVVRDTLGRIFGQTIEVVDVNAMNVVTSGVKASTQAQDLYLSGNTFNNKVIVATPFVANSGASIPGILSLHTQQNNTKKVVLSETGLATDDASHNYYGLGMGSGFLRYQVADTSGSHRFFAGTSSSTSKQLLSINADGSLDVAGPIRAPSVSNPLRLDLNMTGDVYGGTTLSLLNRDDNNGATLIQTGTTQDLVSLTMTTNCSSRLHPLALVAENRVGLVLNDTNRLSGGELQIFTRYGGFIPTAAFGNMGSRINSNLTVKGQLSLYGPSTISEAQGVYTDDPHNTARAPPSLCQKMVQIYHNGQAYGLPLYNLSAVATFTGSNL